MAQWKLIFCISQLVLVCFGGVSVSVKIAVKLILSFSRATINRESGEGESRGHETARLSLVVVFHPLCSLHLWDFGSPLRLLV